MWKLILNSEIKEMNEIVDSKRVKVEKEVFTIITSDSMNIILGEYVKNPKGDLEINEEKYKSLNNNTYHKCFCKAVSQDSRNKAMNPTKDVTSLVEACEYLHEVARQNEESYEKESRLGL